MSVVIAGRQVKKGDALYHCGLGIWGTVDGFDGGSAKVLIRGGNGRQRSLYMQSGGYINGKRQFYWHEPIQLDLPYQNINRLQRVLNAVIMEFCNDHPD